MTRAAACRVDGALPDGLEVTRRYPKAVAGEGGLQGVAVDAELAGACRSPTWLASWWACSASSRALPVGAGLGKVLPCGGLRSPGRVASSCSASCLLLWLLPAARFAAAGSARRCGGGTPEDARTPEAAMAEREVPAATDQPTQPTQPTSLPARMGASLWRYWRERTDYQTFLGAAGVLLLASGMFHTVVFLVDGGPWDGPLSWRKPILFGFSFGITLLTLAWVLSYLPHRRRLGWLLAGVLGVAGVAEVFLITMQRWRGVPSHFNEATAFDTTVFRTMGGLVAMVGLAIVTMTVWSFRSLRAAPSMAVAIRVGLVLLVASQLLGGAILANGLAKPDAEAVTAGSTFGAAGGIKVPHAVSLHAVQLLPALAGLLGFTSWAPRQRTRVVLVAAAGYLGPVPGDGGADLQRRADVGAQRWGRGRAGGQRARPGGPVRGHDAGAGAAVATTAAPNRRASGRLTDRKQARSAQVGPGSKFCSARRWTVNPLAGTTRYNFLYASFKRRPAGGRGAAVLGRRAPGAGAR
jgi:hypothetical protein